MKDYVLPQQKKAKQIANYSTHFIHKVFHCFLATLVEIADPTFFKHVVKEKRWVDVMNIEIDALESTGTWEVTTLPPDKKKSNR